MEERIINYILEKKKDIEGIKVEKREIKFNPTKAFITVVIGPRRSGKTYLLYGFIKENKLREDEYLFVNFEEIEGRLEEFLKAHIEIYGKYPKYLFLDEIQSLVGWKREIYRFYESKKFFMFVIGSSSKLLSKELATELRGRTKTVKVYPFSFKEVLRLKGISIKKYYSMSEISRIKKVLKEVLHRGSFPDIVLGHIEPMEFANELLDLVVFKDIIERYGVENRVGLEFYIKNAVYSNSKLFSVNKVYNAAKSAGIRISKNTMYQFEKFLEDVHMFFFVHKFSNSIRKMEGSMPKVFVVDNSIYSFTTYRKDAGIKMESFVFQELVKSGVECNKELFYFSDSSGYEVDFVLKKGGRIKQLIQVTYASSKEEVEQREVRAIVKAAECLKCKDLLVITWDYEGEEKVEGRKIKYLPLWKWLAGLPSFRK